LASRRIDGREGLREDRGTVLIVTMWIVLVLAGLTLVFGRAIRIEAIASANHVASLRAHAAALGALQFLMAYLDGTDGVPLGEEDVVCEAVQVGDAYFWILGPRLGEDDAYSFRIVDEASKVNLNSADVDMLSALPGVTAELAASIVDWRDEDAEISQGGAESEYYLLLEDPYYCKDAPFETVEEVLLVKDATLDILLGEDTNRNGVLDANENDADDSLPDDNSDGTLDGGIWDYVTVYSAEPNTSSSGEERVNINDRDTADLSQLLREVVADDRFFQVMDSVRSGQPFDSMLEFYFGAGLTREEFEQVADQLTTDDGDTIIGRVNVNTAPREVLLCLPGLEEADVDALVNARADDDEETTGIAWVVDVLEEEKAKAIGPYITGRSYQFSADIVSVSGNGRAYRRYRVVVDASQSPPRVLYWKDLTHLGWPLDPTVLDTLRAGGDVSQLTMSVTGKDMR